ncbi:MAG TPA: type II toxin-antitoxin system death-on-curing family toxin [Vineibacter sp.]|nr:type II toxin-antitoxin system death-on-curing family toxin [Vineibacter sp.]
MTGPPRDWEWIELDAVFDAHAAQLAAYGGLPGVRDQGALEGALGRPMNIAAYQPDADAYLLAAAYAHGIANNHPFADGNKRTAFVVSVAFLEVNGYVFFAPENEVIRMFLAVAEGRVSLEELAQWFRTYAGAN